MKTVVVLPNWIGDVVMATPALRAIRAQSKPGDEIVGVMQPYVKDVLRGSQLLDRSIYWSKKTSDRRRRFWGVVQQLRGENFDQAILFTNSLRTAALAYFGGAKRRVGYARAWRSPLLTDRLAPPKTPNGKFAPISAVDYYLDLVEFAGYPSQGQQPVLAVSKADERRVDEIWRKFDFVGKRVVVFNTGGAYGAAKHWPPEHYIALAEQLVKDPSVAVLLICGPQERETVAKIEQAIDHPSACSLADETLNIGLSKAAVARADVLVTTDSGPKHFAAAFATPTVALFGPTDPRWGNSYNPVETMLTHPVACGPCVKRVCPLGHHDCMQKLSVARVYQAVQAHLNKANRLAA
ncbi:lipopolysaccharide heptosyltransferase II [Blastopirellula sp. JC732]|uniref:lipopolysaccharide heptosyltransferase II n=1 Tax=Blastopirellula sediminis TaxID=2894196 RepID=A0A9X1MQR6_9BACT|nr:lipopolysaccharide heptosyltransferase II [Blastopirellula sediminis]MCC9605694.1 lipopolysaccharide heptosyltransferase II [Blastopirellula sediminis]MCC9631006.1 lipopolysaccharide heptosyltransferase II [Blastopirellula sediminis]